MIHLIPHQMNLTLTIFALATLWTPARAAIITRQSTCSVSNAGTGVTLNASGPNDCSLSTANGPLSNLPDVFSAASTVANQLYVSASVTGVFASGCCITFPYITMADASASVEETYQILAFGPERPGVLQVSFALQALQGYSAESFATVQIPGLLFVYTPLPGQAGCSFVLNTCDFPVTLGQVYPLSLSASASGYADPVIDASASATVQFFESDGTTPAAFTLDAPVSGVPEPDSAILAYLGIFVLFAFRQKATASVRSTTF